MLLYAVTDRAWIGKQTLYDQVEEALKGGITCLQLREKELAEDAFLAEAMELKQLCKNYEVPFIINDNVEIAVKCQADGIHIGQEDMDACEVRRMIGPQMLLGVSAQTVEQALKAEQDGADYLGVGAVFSTTTKADAVDVPRSVLCQICRSVKIPVVAIGGINEKNIMELAGSGADGVALVSAIFSAKDIKSECQKLRRLSERMVKEVNFETKAEEF